MPPSMFSLLPSCVPRWTGTVVGFALNQESTAKWLLNHVDEAVQYDEFNLELHAIDTRLEGPL